MKSLAKNSVWNMIYQAANVIFPLLSYMYVSRILLADGVGKVADAQNTVAYFTAIAALGLPEYAMRGIAGNKDRVQERNKLFTEILVLNTLYTTAALLLYVGCIIMLPGMRQELPLHVSCGLLIVLNYFNVDWFFQGMEEYGYIVGRNLLVKLLSVIALFVFVHSEDDVIIYALISTFTMGGNYIFNAFYIRRFAKLDFSGLNLGRHMKPILILMLTAMLGSIYHQVDITMLGIIKTDANVAYYVYGSKIILIIVQICNAIPVVFMPRLVYYYQNDSEKFEELIDTGIRVLLFLAVPVSAAVFILAPEIVELMFGPAFLPTAKTIRWLVPTIIIRSFGNLLCYELMLCTGNEKKRLPAYIAATLSNVVLNMCLIPVMAENGAAIATVVCEFVVNGYQLNYIRKQVPVRLDKKAFYQSVLSTGAMIAAILCVNVMFRRCFIKVSVAVVVGSVVYLGINLLMRNNMLCMVLQHVKRSILAVYTEKE